MYDFLDLKDKKILITGASSGIGKETATLLSKLGVKVILTARDEERLKQTLEALAGASHSYYCFDLKKIDEIESFVLHVVEENGKLDGLVHCAGIAQNIPLQNSVFQAVHDTMLLNFYAFMELVRIFAKKKVNNNGGSVVAMSSVAGASGQKSLAAYGASKAALDSALSSLALELHPKNIRLNSVQAGFVNTPESNRYFTEHDGDDTAKYLLHRQYMGIIEPLYVANTIAFLLSNSSAYTSGRAIPVDGGFLT